MNTSQSTWKEIKYKILKIEFIKKRILTSKSDEFWISLPNDRTLSTIARSSVGRTLMGNTGASTVNTIGLSAVPSSMERVVIGGVVDISVEP